MTCRRLCLCPPGCRLSPAAPHKKAGTSARLSWTLPLGTSRHAARKPNQSAAVWRCQSSYSPCYLPAISCPVTLAFKSSQLSGSERAVQLHPGRTIHCRAHEHSIGCTTLPTHQGHLPGERQWTLPLGRQPGTQNVLSKDSWGTFNDEPHGCSLWSSVGSGADWWVREAPRGRGGAGWEESDPFLGNMELACSRPASTVQGAERTATAGAHSTPVCSLWPSTSHSWQTGWTLVPRGLGSAHPAVSASLNLPHPGPASGKEEFLRRKAPAWSPPPESGRGSTFPGLGEPVLPTVQGAGWSGEPSKACIQGLSAPFPPARL